MKQPLCRNRPDGGAGDAAEMFEVPHGCAFTGMTPNGCLEEPAKQPSATVLTWTYSWMFHVA
jgi:hypothetical protein